MTNQPTSDRLDDAIQVWGLEGVALSDQEALDLMAATGLLLQKVSRDRVKEVIRRPAPSLGDRSLLDLARAGEFTELRAAVVSMLDLRRTQP